MRGHLQKEIKRSFKDLKRLEIISISTYWPFIKVCVLVISTINHAPTFQFRNILQIC